MSMALCSKHLTDTFTTNGVVFCITFCFCSRVFASSFVRISLANLNLLLRLSFSPPHLNFFLNVIRVTSRVQSRKNKRPSLYRPNKRTLLCLFNKSGREDLIFKRVWPFVTMQELRCSVVLKVLKVTCAGCFTILLHAKTPLGLFFLFFAFRIIKRTVLNVYLYSLLRVFVILDGLWTTGQSVM